jgi:hypothetical protein
MVIGRKKYFGHFTSAAPIIIALMEQGASILAKYHQL